MEMQLDLKAILCIIRFIKHSNRKTQVAIKRRIAEQNSRNSHFDGTHEEQYVKSQFEIVYIIGYLKIKSVKLIIVNTTPLKTINL
jgi:hypothetical protein